MSPCEPLAQRMLVRVEPPWAQRGLQMGEGGGDGGGDVGAGEWCTASAAGDLKGYAVRQPHSTQRNSHVPASQRR